MCGELFDSKLLSLDTNRIFDESYKQKLICWRGTLTNVESYPFDFVFGGEPGTKAIVEIHEMEDSFYGTKKISAVVQLPAEVYDELKAGVGQEISFKGCLHSVDGFVNNLYVKAGQLQEALAS